MDILRERVFYDQNYPHKKLRDLMEFFDHIFSQDLAGANRRKNQHWFKNYDGAYLQMTSMLKTKQKISQMRFFKLLKKLGIIHTLKSLYKMLNLK
ncbi:hypothetical protein [Helicobacter sp. 11S03491-1]|uniref:hypothetical protein n=1 Tax=Helicobacter sp. 11S03491-1 TaxID=1476196 RepID=UPI000BA6C424|nr:hypothetical protein [Helicobacter sp. 11S03491-1]PAF43768.1 hypothetical protein BKH45_00430 [Helicobacter sp. 11S03491-1]